MPLFEFIIGQTEIAAGKHLFPVAVVLERPRLTFQLVNHMPVIDEMPVFPTQAGKSVHAFLGIEKIKMFGKKMNLYGFTDKSTLYRVNVVVDTDGAAGSDADGEALAAFQALFRKSAQDPLFFQKPFAAALV